ncbi:MAG TPA: Rrf2 family transcriptional regulator [Amycolatopsis sp.]|uniref:RrF2 family transcriptional regulator n=1 Tax=Amycolatopsis sp. TaxID=37632 RepID=UPI002B45C575|nr:Rrf2 family transcriptional regulator [Amycolatopsis sp.]HKS45021.1 Rrf2 family transcriptional regulator [Amycolatopsis sp.]
MTRATDIALRALMLAAVKDEQTTVDELAAALSVPRHHLAKVVQRLAQRDLLTTTRGRTGGLRIAPGAAGWSVGQIVRDFESDLDVVDCEDPPCPLRGACRLRSALRRAHEAFLSELDGVTLADLIAPPTGALLHQIAAPLT